MKKKNLKKLLLAVCCAALLVCVSIGATVAYLTSAQKVVNTFTVGNVTITLDEAKVNAEGVEVNANGGALAEGEKAPRVGKNSYKLMPGHDYKKDPTVHVDSNSEPCWVFVKVENGITTFEDTASTITSQITSTTNGWTQLLKDADGNDVEGVYYKANVQPGAELKVFDHFKIADDANTKAGWSNVKDANITVTAYAIQADGFTNAADAWEQVKGITVTNP